MRPFDNWLVRKLARGATPIWLSGSDSEEFEGAGRGVTIPHGDYRPWLRRLGVDINAAPDAEATNALCFGILRPYKRFEEAISAFDHWGQGKLTIAGEPVDLVYAASLKTQIAATSPRVDLIDRRLDDAELIKLVQSTNLVIVPYADLYNSGVILFSLSLGRPVALKRSPASVALLTEFGEQWIRIWDSTLTAADLSRMFGVSATQPYPVLAGRDWREHGLTYASTYRAATDRKQFSRRH